MSVKEYSKILDTTQLSFEGNNISSFCKSFLKGLLEKNINRRFSYDEANSHPWIVLIKDKVEDIQNKYSIDPEKMISELNKDKVDNLYFMKKDYFCVNLPKKDELEFLISKKRNRNNKK